MTLITGRSWPRIQDSFGFFNHKIEQKNQGFSSSKSRFVLRGLNGILEPDSCLTFCVVWAKFGGHPTGKVHFNCYILLYNAQAGTSNWLGMIRNEPSFMVRLAFSEFAKSCHATWFPAARHVDPRLGTAACPNRAWPAAVGRVPTLSQANTAPDLGSDVYDILWPSSIPWSEKTWPLGSPPPNQNGGLELGATSYIIYICIYIYARNNVPANCVRLAYGNGDKSNWSDVCQTDHRMSYDL